MRYALVKDNVVCSVILWDGETPYEPEEGCVMYEVPDEISPGWTIADNQWAPPIPVEIPVPSETEAIETAKIQALLELTALGMSEATARTIVGLPPIDSQE
ncbi:hypothetical protein SEA_DIZZYRUDY_22 [Microbacterium phage DizzyRudy]|nr:hypothetical protein SEA_DIZZYRUDY_22 [Microbacterium phage DizzyRudy]